MSKAVVLAITGPALDIPELIFKCAAAGVGAIDFVHPVNLALPLAADDLPMPVVDAVGVGGGGVTTSANRNAAAG